jgi:uncharacterized protein YdaU (DUF1376 family)
MSRKKIIEEIQYVSLEAGAFLSDSDFQAWDAETRGCYVSIIFYLYENNGRVFFDIDDIGRLCNANGNFREKIWPKLERKFEIKNPFLYHKRVTKELNKAARLLQAKKKAGLMGAEKRWHSHSTPIANQVQDNKTKTKTCLNINSSQDSVPQGDENGAIGDKNSQLSLVLGLKISETLSQSFPLMTPTELSTFTNVTRHLSKYFSSRDTDPAQAVEILRGWITDSKGPGIRRPKAFLVERIKKETGYEKKRRIL